MNKKKLIYIIIGVLSAVIVTGGIIFYLDYDKNIKKNMESKNNRVEKGYIVTESKDISILENNENILDEDINIEDNNKEDDEKLYFIEGDFLSDGIVSDEEKIAMEINTKYLQALIDNAKENQIIKLPAGTFYFSSGGENIRGEENYVAKLDSNVHIEGAGINEEVLGEYTILKPYAEKDTIKFGLDMFYWNEYADSNFQNPEYVENISFKNFIIDGEDVRGNKYNSSGKGFMINLCKNCSWDSMIVRNTDGTGFGMDNVINGSITNSIAVNCGKNATTTSFGASGFGIGTGYSEEESMYIANCKSIGNTKYGFFFENQNRFGFDRYTATEAAGFVVVNSYATGNLYNFGGERANDVVYINCNSDKDITDTDGTIVGYTKEDIHFSDESRRVNVINFETNNYYEDITDENTYFYDSVNWSLRNGYFSEITNNNFGIGEKVSRAEAITLLWRYAGRPGNVLTREDLSSTSSTITDIKTGFTDVPGNMWYANAIKWAKEVGVTNGTSATTFDPNVAINRADFIAMLWRNAGSPKVDTNIPFNDVDETAYYYEALKWGYNKNIVKGISENEFRPLSYCTREQVITFLHRYGMLQDSTYSIDYLLFNGKTKENKTSYISGTDTFTLNEPAKEGYTFIGWTGSNGNVPEKKIIIDKDDVGNKVYIANFKKNS